MSYDLEEVIFSIFSSAAAAAVAAAPKQVQLPCEPVNRKKWNKIF